MEQIQLKHSEKNTPYLEFPNLGFISFVNWSKTNVGYRHLNLTFNHGHNISLLTDVKLKFKKKQKAELKRIGVYSSLEGLSEILTKLINNDGVIPFKNIDKLGKLLKEIDEFELKEKEPVKLKRVKDKKKGFLKKERRGKK